MAVVAMDWDHTLFDHATGQLLPGARDGICILREHGHKIIIHSCNQASFIEATCLLHDLRYDGIWDKKGKPVADCYVDDKGFHFTNWADDKYSILDRLNMLIHRRFDGSKEGK